MALHVSKRLPRFLAIAAMMVCSALVFLISRGIPPFEWDIPAPGIVALYLFLGLGWAALPGGPVDPLRSLTAATGMSLAGMVVAAREHSLPLWLIGAVAAAAALVLAINVGSIHADMRNRTGHFGVRLLASLSARLPSSVKAIAAKEAQLWIAVVRPSRLHRKFAGMAQFSLGRRGSDVMVIRVLTGIGLIELFVVHLFLRTLYPTLALVLLALSAIALIYLLGVARSLTAMPTTLGPETLTVRLGALREQAIPLAQIREILPISGQPDGKQAKLTLSIVDPPNVRLQLREPLIVSGLLGINRQCEVVDFRVDEPTILIGALHAALDQMRETQASSEPV